MTRLSLAQRILALDAALEQIPHAFGGALALAYYAEPRATVDIDVNLFVTTDRFPEVAGRLIALGVDADDPAVGQIVRRDGQARLMWDATPIDLFFARTLSFNQTISITLTTYATGNNKSRWIRMN